MNNIRVCVAEDTKYEIIAEALQCGQDWNIYVCGGTLHHIGAVVVCAEGKIVSDKIVLPSHRDDVVAQYFAKTIGNAVSSTVCVVAGIHIDNASQNELQRLICNSQECCKLLLKKIFVENNYSFVE